MKIFQAVAIVLALLANPAHAKKAKQAAKVVEPEPKGLSSLQMAGAGAFATAFGVVIVHPVDTIKTLQQSTEGAGLNILAATSKILKDGGIPALYSGLGPYVVSDGCAGALKFATYEVLKKWIKDKVPDEDYGKALFLAAGAAFLVSSVVLVPGELLKQRLQMGQINSVREGIPQIFKSEGILGFYAGYSGVCLRDVPYTMMELGIYDNFKSMYLKFKNRNLKEGDGELQSNKWDELLAAAVSGGITGFLTAPLDNVKTKLMVDVGYSGFFDCLAKTVKTGGMSSLFAGSAARVAWLMPFTAIYLPVYEIIKRKMIMPAPTVVSALAVKGGHVANDYPIFGRRPAVPHAKSLKMKSSRVAGTACF
mmetsp:Transcript_13121/g.19121  ORF Transcript_13121/g.19121 Transcript_13121/m.19121 type:complete len:365 (+) Transcript_13121:165-1259(+)|eukprot:CAMPEP_0197234754 /NCGR_PEP_ID=MMETSP1429-20130617/2422_1 /TAXON_ID=49237 /ORGANISM="Chaetoceros  sp., Strain UNC1202" /LENGTH=364 /DNA_ID=CAMNT_0042693233 /DNA_START=98 /DNA_END=1192 /DNA_ORIENTATION=-